METNIAVVFGVGPGLGAALARRFARGGFAIALLARRAAALADIEKAIVATGGRAISVAADATDPQSVAAAFAEVRAKLGDPGVLVYNAGAFVRGGVLDLDPDQFDRAWKANCAGALYAAREVIPAMLARSKGTILLTGATASLRGSAMFAGLAVGKFGLRALGQSMARELHPKGIHVAHVIIDGQIDPGGASSRPSHTKLDPDAIAEAYWQLHTQPATTWTHELDLRPSDEKF